MSGVIHPVFAVGVGMDVLSLVRLFGAKGVPCWACSSQRVPGTFSRYAKYWSIPDPQLDEQGMIDRILELAERVDGRPVLFTGTDQHAQALARHRDVLEQATLPCVAPGEIVDLLVHKGHFGDWAEKHVPSFPKAMSALEFSPAGADSFPVVAKPYHRGFSNATKLSLPSENELHERRFTLLNGLEEWEAYRQRHTRYLPHIMIQEFVHGTSTDMYTVGIYADRDSEIKGTFVGRKVRSFPAMYGDGMLVQSDTVPDEILAEVLQITRTLGYSGIAEFEFKKDTVSGQFRLLEINPRCWGWVGITMATDCNIPWIAYQDLTGIDVPSIVCRSTPGATKMVLLLKDASNVFLRYRFDHPEWVMSPLQWWRSLRAERLVIWEFDRRDWRGSAACALWILYQASRYAWRGLAGRLRKAIGRDGHPEGGTPS